MTPRPAPRPGRFRELDDLRGIAAVAVVWSHLTTGYDSKYPDEPSAPVDLGWGAYGVQLFFLISGFVILMTVQRVQRPSGFVISRLARLFPSREVS
ncbi:acyltransferase family protein [Brachybacterium sp. Marseille-Q7125]|uniref:acyltransferase family protein n=1 Tax=Brachybacterium sp. Marseille-Q7125 TaxID=2932815 RepID=UPI001FF624BD|nr:acyltransferase family protein [Brachybacterium sp. Marseille-Q7125]